MKLKRGMWSLALAGCAALLLLTGCDEDAAGARTVMNFNTGWKWIDADVEGGERLGLDESQAVDVSLPHSTVLLDLFEVEPEEWRKVTWYRRHFSLPVETASKRVNVQFQGAGQVNKVYVNGHLVGESKGYFTSFDFDIEKYIRFGDVDNVIAVEVDSTEHPEIPPTGSDFHYFGGIHRDVIMTVTGLIRVDDAFVWTEPSSEGVTVKAEITVANGSREPRAVRLGTVLVDADERPVTVAGTRAVVLGAGEEHVFEIAHKVKEPRLWSLDDPYLHQFVTQVKADDEIVDLHQVTTGLRWVSADPKGTDKAQLYLNGEPIRMFGVNRHEQYPYIGFSAPNHYHRRDARLLKYDAGCNVVRTSHYTNDPEFMDECDRIGLLVVAENLGWQTIVDDAWKKVYEESLAAMVLRDRNHPSIMIWSVMVNEGPTNELDWERTLNAMVKKLDPTRLTADHTNQKKAELIPDVWHRHCYPKGGNYVEPSYQPWVVGEFNNVLGSNFVIPNDSESRKVQMLLKDGEAANKLWGNPRVAGIIRWDAFGYITPNNVEVYGRCNQHKNFGEYRNSGIYGCYRQPRYLSRWWQAQAKPDVVGDVVHILSEWKSDSSTTVYVASNADEVELFRDGTTFGRIKPNCFTEMERGLFQWDRVAWDAGSRLVARAYRNGVEVAETVRFATSYDNEKTLVLESKSGPAIVADGADLAWIEARILDENGQVSDYADANLSITKLKGPAEAVFKTTPIQYQNPPEGAGLDKLQMTDGHGVFYLRSKLDEAGAVKVVAVADIGVSVDNGAVGGAAEITYYPEEAWTTEPRVEAYGGDVHMVQGDDAVDCHIDIRFTGEQLRIYGGRAAGFGLASITIDGGDERIIDVATMPDRERENMLLYTSPLLVAGEHVVTITPLLRKRAVEKKTYPKAVGLPKSFGFSLDRVKVMDGKADLESKPVVIKVKRVTDKLVPAGA